VRELDEVQMLVVNLSENVQREDLNIVQEAKGVQQLRDRNLSYNDIAEKIGRSSGWVQIRCMVASFPDKLKDKIVENKLSSRHIRDLYTPFHKGDIDGMWELYRAIVSSGGKRIKPDSVIKDKVSKKRIRNSTEVHLIQDMLYEKIGPNVINTALSWAIGEVDDKEFHIAIKEELEIYKIEYKVPEYA
jgi:hypothetical protein